MKLYPVLLPLGMAAAFLCVQASASSESSSFANARKPAEASREMHARTPRWLSEAGSPAERHLFPVMDEKGLLLTCIAPEMETNKETDDFKNCVLAPGRTLDDVMHSFVGAAHQQQLELDREKAAASQHADNKAETKSASK